MKKWILMGAILFTGVGAFAEGNRIHPGLAIEQEKSKLKDCVMMKNGSMFVVKDGETTEMMKAVIMSNGTKVLANGEVFLKDGETFKLENGDVVYMNGKVEKKAAGATSGF